MTGEPKILPKFLYLSSTTKAFVVLLFCVASIVGCSVLRRIFIPKVSPFNHAIHVVENDIPCSDCHQKSTRESPPTLPRKETCKACHDPKEDKEIFEAFFSAVGPKWVHEGALPKEVRFPHSLHLKSGIPCKHCHQNVLSSTEIKKGISFRMDWCLNCHKPSEKCETCHKKISPTYRPSTHTAGWDRRHGKIVRSRRRLETADRCELCHAKEDCSFCHTQRKPPDHSVYWQSRGHGTAAGIDRERCEVCHTRDVCDRCHKSTTPRNHRGSFGSPFNRHCFYCHMPLDYSESCSVCHRETPSHERAPAVPADSVHLVQDASRCRSCHQDLRHPDNGDDCRWCHRSP